MWSLCLYFVSIVVAIYIESIQFKWGILIFLTLCAYLQYNGFFNVPMPFISFTHSRALFALENSLPKHSKKKKSKTPKREEKTQNKSKRKKRKRKKASPALPSVDSMHVSSFSKDPRSMKDPPPPQKQQKMDAGGLNDHEVDSGSMDFIEVVSKKTNRKSKKNKPSSRSENRKNTKSAVQTSAETEPKIGDRFTHEELDIPPPEEIEALKAAKNAEIKALEAQVEALRARSANVGVESSEISTTSSSSETVDLIKEDYVYVSLPAKNQSQGADEKWSTVGKSGKAKVASNIHHCGTDEPAFKTFDQNHVKQDKEDEKHINQMYGEGKVLEKKRIELSFAIPAVRKEDLIKSKKFTFEPVTVTPLSSKTLAEIEKNTKPKRKRHRLHWGEICNALEVQTYEIVNASSLYHACFLHAVLKRELKLREIRGIFQSALFILQKDPAKFVSSSWNEDRISLLINELQKWLDTKPRVDLLPKALWSPEPLKCAVAMAVGQSIVIVNPYHVKADNEPISVDDLVICERFDPDGSVHVVTDKNLLELTRIESTCFIYFPSEAKKHWFYFDFSYKSADP